MPAARFAQGIQLFDEDYAQKHVLQCVLQCVAVCCSVLQCVAVLTHEDYAQKSPTNVHKSPIYDQKSHIYVQKSHIYFPKSPISVYIYRI